MKTRVIYIAGQSFSGSTLLCALLGVHPDLEPVSELAMWTTQRANPRRRCACGEFSKDCPFWIAVRENWLAGDPRDTVRRYAGLQTGIEGLAYQASRLLKVSATSSPEFNEYGRLTVALYKAVADVSGRPVIVDSSKKPGRALAISRMAGLDVSIIHLVRNGLSYVESNIKRKKILPQSPDYLYRIFRLGLDWSIVNYAAERAWLANRSRGMRLRYEDMVLNPIESLGALGQALEIDVTNIQEHVTHRRRISFHHMEGGSNHRASGPTIIRTDELPSIVLSGAARAAFNVGAGFLSRRYGYV